MQLTPTELEEIRQTSPEKFIKTASAFYGLDPDGFRSFLSAFEIYLKDGPFDDDNEPVGKTMTEIALDADLPVEVVRRLQEFEVIDRPINHGDVKFLQKLKKIWCAIYFIRKQLANFTFKQREDLVTRPELSNKWERWVYGKYFFNVIDYDSKGRMMNPKDRVLVDEMVESVNFRFNIPICTKTKEKVLKIREMANNDRKRMRMGSISRKEVLANRSIPDTFFELEIEVFGDDIMYS